MKTAPISVELLDHMGTDLTCVNAARVSFDKESFLINVWDDEIMESTPQLANKDVSLIRYLAKHKHFTPFTHCFLSFRVKVPMFVAMQLDKHTVGLSTNSVSRRYVSTEPEFYFPDTWRKAAENVKQGSSSESIGYVYHEFGTGTEYDYGVDETAEDLSREFCEVRVDLYKAFLAAGCCAEQARMLLPMNTMTERIWSGSLAAFARVCKLRLDPHSQKECRDVAELVAKAVEPLFPVSFKALLDN